MGDWQNIILGIFAVGLVFWLYPSVKNAVERSKHAPKDWKGVLIPIALVVAFILFLISTL